MGKHLARRGWSVRLVTAEPDPAGAADPSGMQVDRVPPGPTLGGRYRQWKRSRAGPKTPTRPGHGTVRGPSGPLRTLRREVGGLLAIPDEARGWLGRGGMAVRRAVRAHAPDLVVSTGPPHSVHAMTAWALGRRGPAWVMDLRDPWSHSARHHMDVAWWEPVVARLEASLVRSAQGLLTTTPALATALAERFPGLSPQSFPNGADAESLPSRRGDSGQGFQVVHLGTLYRHRDPSPLVRAFARFVSSQPEAQDARLRFVGPVVGGRGAEVEALAAEIGVAGQVTVEAARDRSEALEVLAGAGVAVVLAQNQPTQVPGKLYEPVAMGVPTLILTEAGSASDAAGRRLGAAVRSPKDLTGMAAALRAAWSGAWSGALPEGVKVDYAELAEELEELLLCWAEGRPVGADGEGKAVARSGSTSSASSLATSWTRRSQS